MPPPKLQFARTLNRAAAILSGATRLDVPGQLRQILRDLAMIESRVLRGKPPAPTVDRPSRKKIDLQPVEAAAIRPRRVRITEVVRETSDSISIYFEEVEGSAPDFQAGQFMTVEIEIDGERLRRAYSLAGTAQSGARRHVTVKRVPGGRVSNALNDSAEAGHELSVLGPSGTFTLEATSIRPKHVVLIAGGSGITPIMSIASTTLGADDSPRVTLLYGNRSREDIIFRARIAALAEEHEGRFDVDHVLERRTGDEGFDSTEGRLDESAIAARLAARGVEDGPDVVYFVCGPTPMMEAARSALLARGVAPARIREESFGRPEERRSADGATSPQPLTLVHGGRTFQTVAEPGETLLEAGVRSGLAMPFSCAMGGCGACTVRVVEGSVVMDEPNCLLPSEAAEGYALACVAKPTSPCRVEVS